MILAEAGRVALLRQQLADRHLCRRALQVGRCLGVEPSQIAQHVPETAAHQINGLREQAPQIGPGVFESPFRSDAAKDILLRTVVTPRCSNKATRFG